MNTTTHRAIVRDGTDVRVLERPTPRPGPGELLVAPEVAGLCGTDLQMLRGLRDDPAPVIGHEGIAVVVEAGPGTDASLAPGTRVVVNPTHPTDDSFLLGHGVDGLLQERVLLPAAAVGGGLVIPLQATPEPELAALLEPLAVVRYALSALAADRPGTLLVHGDGTIGHLAVRAARYWLGPSVRVLQVHHTEAGRAWSADRAVAADHLLLHGDDNAGVIREVAGSEPLAVLLATPRDATLDCLTSTLATGVAAMTVDLLGGLPPGASTPCLPGADLAGIRAANRAGLPEPPHVTTLTATTGGTVRLLGHRGVGNGHLRAAAEELTHHPERYREVVTHTADLTEAARIMAHLARRGDRVVDGRRLVKLAVRVHPPRHALEA
ncbi:alcohol dehydrogenase catalytic domain-containing protein [Streptomyces triculaminicus]|uniref:alcohol dehydrogenase catalytic domain-containing protein n=1 Tax=Streptomyces triculaminicus TaxID=2816232 RepID=UPI0037D9297A